MTTATYYKTNREKIKKYNNTYYLNNKETIINQHKTHNNRNKTKVKEYNANYYQKNKKKIAESVKKYYEEHRDKIKTYKKQYQQKNKVRLAVIDKLKYEKNKVRLAEQAKIYRRKKRKEDISFRLLANLRTRLSKAVRGTKSKTTMELIGCSMIQLREHLEDRFKPDMSWDNYGQWHIDHIRPCSSFDLTNPEQQKECFNYKNLQPLWAKDNLFKGNRQLC